MNRACRLKKKAQHEANKIKLHGLEHEHKKLLSGIAQMKQLLIAKVNNEASNQEEINKHIEKVVKNATSKYYLMMNWKKKKTWDNCRDLRDSLFQMLATQHIFVCCSNNVNHVVFSIHIRCP